MISLLLSEKKEDTIIGNKDLAGKQLLQWPDVFADISNVNLFQGEPVLTEECMTPEPAESVSKLDGGKLKEMRFDIHMKYHHGKDTVFFRIENQSDICLTMPLRDMGYQYAGYEKQLQHLKDQNCQKGVTPMRYAHELVDGQKLKPIVTKDERYQLICEELSEKDMKGEVRMCELLDIVENRGLQQGQEKLNALIRKLMAEGRYEELARSAADSEYQKELMRECHIIT